MWIYSTMNIEEKKWLYQMVFFIFNGWAGVEELVLLIIFFIIIFNAKLIFAYMLELIKD